MCFECLLSHSGNPGSHFYNTRKMVHFDLKCPQISALLEDSLAEGLLLMRTVTARLILFFRLVRWLLQQTL